MRKCRNCGKDILTTIYGLKSFCSHDCKKAHRKAYMADLMATKRGVSISSGYLSINSQNVSNSKPYQKPIYKGLSEGHGLSGDNFESYGGKEWYEMAKTHCCNFEVREKEGNCLTLSEPYFLFTKLCNECDLGMALNLKYE